MTVRRALAVSVVATCLAVAGAVPATASNSHRPTEIVLPTGFQPEGIDTGPGRVAYIGSFTDGSIFRADLRTGEGEVFFQGPGTPTLGVETDRRGRLFAAGGPSGTARVIDTGSGELIETYELADESGLVNDLVVTREAVYLTDSFKAQLYVLPLGRRGALPRQDEVEVVELTGDFELVGGGGVFNANGIEVTPDGEALLVVQTKTGLLFRVDPQTGATTTVDLGGELLEGGDGLTLDGDLLYVAQYSTNTVAVVDLDDDGSSGEVVRRITDDRFSAPTTTDTRNGRLYVVNSQFTTPVTPETEYSVSIVQL